MNASIVLATLAILAAVVTVVCWVWTRTDPGTE